ncbi:unnamed protein product [Polarella glacialis]|uniref:Uncharacterized protein n=1 Tax=Polarella glacialis TaxID=89957 RepID=A0A813DPT8_POLGL|nr:unnamed protein product [Polarella glacialis]CAE8679721.1 unnamed protein product [Polarella glacialis]
MADGEEDLQQEEDLHADPLDSQIADKEVDLQQEEDLHADPLDSHRADEEEDLQQDLEDQMLRVLLMSQLGGQTYMAGEKPAAAVSEAIAAQICQRQAGTGLAAVGGTLQLCQPSVSLIQKWKTRTPNHNNNNNNHNGPGIFESAFAGCPAEEPAVVVVAASRMGRHCCSCSRGFRCPVLLLLLLWLLLLLLLQVPSSGRRWTGTVIAAVAVVVVVVVARALRRRRPPVSRIPIWLTSCCCCCYCFVCCCCSCCC